MFVRNVRGEREHTMTERGEAYIPMVKPVHTSPTKFNFTSSRTARSVNAITEPKKPTFNIATILAIAN